MTTPTQFSNRGGSEPREDCRDFLRTGRCKYGASCKYNHPPNVQSGGGMKGPMQFPIRPTEPTCPYYMKHGNCKFGQACKFNHPPQATMAAALVGGNAVVMNVGRNNDVPQILLNTGSTDSNGSMVLQLLPQRPDTQDCTYFLKHGRCKYGATCKYNHPIHIHHQTSIDDGSRRQQQQSPSQHVQAQQARDNVSQVQLITPSTSYHHQPGHLIVSDGSFAYVALDRPSSSQGSYQTVSVSNANGSKDYYTVSSLRHGSSQQGQERGSSSSSIASSYDTAVSSIENIGSYSDLSNGFWNNSKKTGSANSLNAYLDSSSHMRQQVYPVGSRVVLAQSASEGSIASRPYRAASGESESSGVFYDARPPPHSSYLSPSFDHSRRATPPGGPQDDRMDTSPSISGVMGPQDSSGAYYSRERVRSPMLQGRPPVSGQRPQQHVQPQRRGDQGDEGFSMMTSALLNMLDAPEDVVRIGGPGQPPSNEQMNTQDLPRHSPGGYLRPNPPISPRYDRRSPSLGPLATPQATSPGSMQGYDDYNRAPQGSPSFFPGSQFHQSEQPHVAAPGTQQTQQMHQHDHSRYSAPQEHHARDMEHPQAWSPTWEGSNLIGSTLERNAQSLPVMRARPQDSSHTSPDVGLYLP